MIRFGPVAATFHKLAGRNAPDITTLARDRWDVAPATTAYVAPAICLPGQVERIRATAFASVEQTIRVFRGDFETREDATRAFRLSDVDLVDGILFGRGGQRHLQPGRRRVLPYTAPAESMNACIYESWVGNRWFGSWLMEDCVTYRLAEAFGQPVTTQPAGTGHKRAYEHSLDMRPLRIQRMHFDELILFSDEPNNAGKTARSNDMRRRLLADAEGAPVPGVFLLRGDSGDRRVLVNERELAEQVAAKYGFRILDVMANPLDAIVEACGNAQVVMGVEGSQFVHGSVLMPPGAAALVIQPPYRTCATLKLMTDRRGQIFAFVVAEGGEQQFMVTWADLERTLDLVLAAQDRAGRS